MQTIFVVYGHTQVDHANNTKAKKYAFVTKETLAIGDIIACDKYSTKMLVTDILKEEFKYYNNTTGEVSNTITSTSQYPIKELRLKENTTSEVLYFTKES